MICDMFYIIVFSVKGALNEAMVNQFPFKKYNTDGAMTEK